MEKKVFCVVGDRCKSIQYTLKQNEKDVEVIRRRLQEACKTDKILDLMMRNKYVILQKKDSDRNNNLRDIDDHEEVEDKSDIHVVLIALAQSISLADMKPSSSDYKSLCSGQKTSNQNQDVKDIINAEFILVDSITEVTAIEKVMSEDSTVTQLEEAGPSTSAEVYSEPVVSERLSSTGTKYSIPMNMALPPLSYDLGKRIEKDGITAKNRRYFIAHWGSYLWNMTSGNPKPRDYKIFTESIIKTYPTLQSGDDGCSLVQLQLSIWIRNHRRYTKPKPEIQGPTEKRSGKAKLPVENAALVPTNTIQENETNLEHILKELEKKFVKGVNVSHVRNLLKITVNDRRPWIENDANRIVDILKKYPALGDGGMILFEFITLKNLDKNEFLSKIDCMIKQLMVVFSIPPDGSEIRKIEAVKKMYDHLLNKKFSSKKITPIIVMKEVMTAATCLRTKEAEAPRLVIYTNRDTVSSAYIVADEEVKIELEDPSAKLVIAILFASYFVWNRSYPAAYANMLLYMEHALLGEKINRKNVSLIKFVHNVRNSEKLK